MDVQQVRLQDQKCGTANIPVEVCPGHLVKGNKTPSAFADERQKRINTPL
jgi:NAD-dependent dihydropyrimidine dehydrogenase PreA subunit